MKYLEISFKYLALLLIIVIMSGGCKRKTTGSFDTESKENETITVTMIAKSSVNPVFISAREGAEQAAAKLSEKYNKINVQIDWRTPETENAEEQVILIQEAVNNGSHAIIISCSDEEILTPAINFAVENNVPVMTFDSDAPESKRFAFFGPDDEEIGIWVMDELAERLNKQGQIAILGGNANAPNLKKRIQGILKSAEKYPNITIVGAFYHGESSTEAIAKMMEVNKNYTDLDGWAMVGGWPFFNDTLLKVLTPNQYTIVAVDALPEQLPYIEKDIVQALLGQPVFKWGELSVMSVIDKVYLEKEVPESIKMNLIPVSKSNLGGWSRQLRAWGFKNIPEKYLKM